MQYNGNTQGFTSGEVLPTVPPTPVIQYIPVAADILIGFSSVGATQAATTFMTIPAGRTWVGQVSIDCMASEASAGVATAQATAIVSIAGAGATPAAGNILRCTALANANVAGGTVSANNSTSTANTFTVIAPAANVVTLQLATTNSGSFSEINVTASGVLY